jgi:hypothetical protein
MLGDINPERIVDIATSLQAKYKDYEYRHYSPTKEEVWLGILLLYGDKYTSSKLHFDRLWAANVLILASQKGASPDVTSPGAWWLFIRATSTAMEAAATWLAVHAPTTRLNVEQMEALQQHVGNRDACLVPQYHGQVVVPRYGWMHAVVNVQLNVKVAFDWMPPSTFTQAALTQKLLARWYCKGWEGVIPGADWIKLAGKMGMELKHLAAIGTVARG